MFRKYSKRADKQLEKIEMGDKNSAKRIAEDKIDYKIGMMVKKRAKSFIDGEVIEKRLRVK